MTAGPTDRSCLSFACDTDHDRHGIVTRAPGNGAAIGGLKVVAESGWFAARPSGTEDIYKIYAESFRGDDHLRLLVEEAQAIVTAALAATRTP